MAEEVRLIVDLFENFNFSGSRRTLIRDLADFNLIEFNDRASSVIVTAGPNFVSGDAARLWSNINFQGHALTLPPGQYPNLASFNFNDVASSLNIVNLLPAVIAEDTQREVLQFTLQIITPPGSTLISVQNNRIISPRATGIFVGDTGVRVTGTFIDNLTVLIREANGTLRSATGQTTLSFTKNLNFPQLAGLDKSNLIVEAIITNVTSSFILNGNILTKTVQFDLTTRVIRNIPTTAAAAEIKEAAETGVEHLGDYPIEVE